MKRFLIYNSIFCFLFIFLFSSDSLFAREMGRERTARRAEKLRDIISVGDEVAFRNEVSGKYIDRDPGSNTVRYSTSYQDRPSAVFTVKNVSDNKEEILKTHKPVFIKFPAKKNLAIGRGWRELVASESKEKDAQWRFFIVGSDLSESVYDGDRVLIQNVSKPDQYLFTYFGQFPVHDKVNLTRDNEPADNYAKHAVYIIEKVKKDKYKEPVKAPKLEEPKLEEERRPERRIIRRDVPVEPEEKRHERVIIRTKPAPVPVEQEPVSVTPQPPPTEPTVPGVIPVAPAIPTAPEIPAALETEKRADLPSKPTSFLEEIRTRAGKPVRKEEKPVSVIPPAPPVLGVTPEAPAIPEAPVIPKAPEIPAALETEKKVDLPSKPTSFLEQIKKGDFKLKPVKREEKPVTTIPPAPPIPTVSTIPEAPAIPTAPPVPGTIPTAPEKETKSVEEKKPMSLQEAIRAKAAEIARLQQQNDDDNDY